MAINRRLVWRRLLRPSSGLRWSFVSIILGLMLLLVGLAVSFKVLIRPLVSGMLSGLRSVLQVIAPGDVDLALHMVGGALLMLGIYTIYAGFRGGMRRVSSAVDPSGKSGIIDRYLKKQSLALGPRIVAIGGGTGLSTLLRGLKQYSSNITAIVTVTDDGGSSGRLSQEKGMLPLGDIRNCLVALADAEKQMTDLFQYRFKIDSGSLSGHSMGNLLMAALVDQSQGDYEKAISVASDVLSIRGRVIPSTLDHVRLRATMADGVEVCGETNIVAYPQPIKDIYLDPNDPEPFPGAIEAIQSADLIVIGPGSVFTSVIPNLLVPGIAEAIQATPAVKAYVCNVMTQKGESEHFTASQHVSAILSNVRAKVFDYVLVNTGVPDPEVLARYRGAGQHLVEPDSDVIRSFSIRVVEGDFMSQTDTVRHDPMRVAARLVRLVGV